MPNIVVFSDGPEGLSELQSLINQLESPAEAPAEAPEPVDLVEDEDLRLIVQIRLPDINFNKTDFYVESWGDTDILPDYLESYRAMFPQHEYRLVAVYDEIVPVDESVEQEVGFLTPEDEIDSLKAEILKLKSEIQTLNSELNYGPAE
jgi:hypothetical protein